jgi:hypothetical protein
MLIVRNIIIVCVLASKFALARDRCETSLPKTVVSFCRASLKEDITEMAKFLPAKISVAFTKFGGPNCEPSVRTVLFNSSDKEFEKVLKIFASSIKSNLEDKIDNPNFGKMSTGRYGTLMMGDCAHETSVNYNSKSSNIDYIRIGEIK